MPRRRDLLIAALLALAAASGAWAERDRALRDSYPHQHRDERRQPLPERRTLPQGGFIQSDGFIHRDRRYRDNDDNRRDHGQNRRSYAGDRGEDRYPPTNARPSRTVNDVIREVEGRYGGKVVGVQTVQGPGGPAYRVRVLQRDGRVKTMVVPGN